MNNEYAEALKRAKELHESGNALTKAQMEIVFPELKQKSVREALKALVVECQSQYNSFAGVKLSDMIHYLENMKPKWSDEDERKYQAIQEDIKIANWRLVAKDDPDLVIESAQMLTKRYWLKKLKKRASWKPTKEMMKALYEAVIRSCSHSYGVHLSELYNCLESL